jgi:hypothetical protein
LSVTTIQVETIAAQQVEPEQLGDPEPDLGLAMASVCRW